MFSFESVDQIHAMPRRRGGQLPGAVEPAARLDERGPCGATGGVGAAVQRQAFEVGPHTCERRGISRHEQHAEVARNAAAARLSVR